MSDENERDPDFADILPDVPPGEERPSPRKSHVKCTDEETKSRVAFAATLASQLISEFEVKQAITKRYGCSFSQAGRYMRAARGVCKQWGSLKRPEVMEMALSILRGMLQGKLTAFEKLAVLDRFINLFGLNAPQEVQVSGPGGGPIQMQEMKPDERNTVRERLLARLRHRLGESAGDGADACN